MSETNNFRAVVQVAIPLTGLVALSLIVAAIWAPYGEWPQGQLAWTGLLLLFVAIAAAPAAIL